MTEKKTRALLELARSLKQRVGCDLVQSFRVSTYNATIATSSPKLKPLTTFGRKSPAALLVGHSRALWPCFIDFLEKNPSHLDRDHPLDRWSASEIESLVKQHFPSVQNDLRFVNEGHPDRIVAFQQLCHLSGLAYLNKDSYLCVHPTLGPWLAFRAVVVLDADMADEDAAALTSPPVKRNPCEDAKCAALHAEQLKVALRTQDWRDWLKVRQVCKVPRAEDAYSADQISYHYQPRLSFLRELIAASAKNKQQAAGSVQAGAGAGSADGGPAQERKS